MPASTAATSTPADRQHVVDRLRGIALLGVLLVNAPFLLTSVDGMTEGSMPAWPDRLAAFVTWTFFQAKSYVVFSFLFGYSLAILLEKVASRNQSASRVYAQRLGALALIGALHACLLFVGDILVVYALLGASLLFLRHRSDRTLLRLAVGLLVVQAALFAGLALLPGGGLASPAWIDESWRSDGLIAATWTRIQVWPIAFGLIAALQGPLVAALFCVGLVCGRRRVLADPEAIRPALIRIRRWGFAVGLPLQVGAGLLGTWPGSDDAPGRLLLALAVTYLTAPILSAAYIAAIALLPRRGPIRWVEADGRMSLSVYLGESLLATTLAAGWGFGLFGLSTGAAFLIALAIWLALSVAAAAWSRHFGTGPAERGLRRLTYAGLGNAGRARARRIPDRRRVGVDG